ncbi:P-loop containing nucleoside triphosphate hydrolase protein [Cyathus striatus]|nr:P-loop containing nucleoside triphosphate hydrolase protein [Cyathus striatus]
MDPLPSDTWNELALQHKLLKDTEHLHEYQIDGANHIIAQLEDICVIAPTGAGKSLLWVLPLLAQKQGISLVIVPFTSLGMQGENRNSSITATFLSSANSSPEVLRNIAQGVGMHVVYTCPEMLETPAVAQVLHSNAFQNQLSGVYIDEAHCVHESLSWRPSYTHLYLLRQVIGSTIPLVALSATLPHRYQDSLIVYAGLQPEYHLINLGNFHPELSTMVKHMQHSVNSFLDLEFVIQLAKQLSVIIYCDDLETLTAMFWWIYKRLVSSQLPVSWLDILHAGLSEKHQRQCIDGVSSGRVRILLGSDKIGAGMDFPSVGLVIQYQCHGLSIVRWEQWKGRGACCLGLTATELILVEKSMTRGLDSTVRSPNLQDPGLLDLVQTQGCLQQCTDKWLENPLHESPIPCTHCSNCNPDLKQIASQYIFVLEDFHKGNIRNLVPLKEAEKIQEELIKWRLEIWRLEWMEQWPDYGPESLVSTADLGEISQHAFNILTIDNLDKVASIVHLNELGPSLLTSLHSAVHLICGVQLDEYMGAPNTPTLGIPTEHLWNAPENSNTFSVGEALAQQIQREGRLEKGEQVIHF